MHRPTSIVEEQGGRTSATANGGPNSTRASPDLAKDSTSPNTSPVPIKRPPPQIFGKAQQPYVPPVLISPATARRSTSTLTVTPPPTHDLDEDTFDEQTMLPGGMPTPTIMRSATAATAAPVRGSISQQLDVAKVFTCVRRV